METDILEIETLINQGEFYQQESEKITETLNKLESLRAELQQAYDRWEYLDGIISYTNPHMSVFTLAEIS